MSETDRAEAPLNFFDSIAQRMAPQAFEDFKAGIIVEDSEDSEDDPSERSGGGLVQIPIWPDHLRGSPNVMVRSALFTAASDRSKRPVLRERSIAAWSGSELNYSGPLLTQYDADVWYQLLHLYRVQNVSEGVRIFFSSRSFLKAIGRKVSGAAANTLADSINRLYVCGLGLRIGSVVVATNHRLVRRYGRDDATGKWSVELEPFALKLFEYGYTRFKRADRLALRTSTAKYLHTYVCSHRATGKHPHRIGLEQLQSLCGQKSQPKRFRRQIRTGMAELLGLGLVLQWGFTKGGALEFVRTGVLPLKAPI